MAKQMGKYFIAIVPKGNIQKKATQLKYEVRDLFNSKYALKSPAHITLKMPFVWNEAKEEKLIDKLAVFFKDRHAFNLTFNSIGRFGRRVIYIKVSEVKALMNLQTDLSKYCKQELKCQQELSDTAYRPHMTICFKDLKDEHFDECLLFLKNQGFSESMEVIEIDLLKKDNYKWKTIHAFNLFIK